MTLAQEMNSILSIVLWMVSCSAVFEWIHPDTWRRDTRNTIDQVKSAVNGDADEVATKTQQTIDNATNAISDNYQKVKEGAKSAKYLVTALTLGTLPRIILLILYAASSRPHRQRISMTIRSGSIRPYAR